MKMRDREPLSAPSFGEVGIRETIRSNRARGPSRYLHKIILAYTNTHINMVIIGLSIEW